MVLCTSCGHITSELAMQCRPRRLSYMWSCCFSCIRQHPQQGNRAGARREGVHNMYTRLHIDTGRQRCCLSPIRQHHRTLRQRTLGGVEVYPSLINLCMCIQGLRAIADLVSSVTRIAVRKSRLVNVQYDGWRHWASHMSKEDNLCRKCGLYSTPPQHWHGLS